MRFIFLTVATAVMPPSIAASEIEVSGVAYRDVEIQYTIDLSDRNLCVLELGFPDEWSERTYHEAMVVHYRFLTSQDGSSEIVPIVKVNPFERFFVRDLSQVKTRFGVVTLYSDELPLPEATWIQLYLKGFNCDAFAQPKGGVAPEDVDYKTLAPKELQESDLITVTSDVFELTPR